VSEKMEKVKELLSGFKGDLERLYMDANGVIGGAEYDLDGWLLKLAEALDQMFEWCSDLADPQLASACLDRYQKLKETWRHLCASHMLVRKAKFDVTGKIIELKKKVDGWIESLG
jgi:hypothetical protein